ncbi:hypothetical protein CHH57_00205 [Niallia circulans]|jgi:hypothetical protein|uniref:Uncharacterized protein n=1 Tax=Niallia circulans TaxID=1397 RepID=A0AA91Z382_NIACI|nr:hypothetical protein [Niallia circulans]PAD85329.1 hypothetical protein CHH57_00205 [Niallia circulans]
MEEKERFSQIKAREETMVDIVNYKIWTVCMIQKDINGEERRNRLIEEELKPSLILLFQKMLGFFLVLIKMMVIIC